MASSGIYGQKLSRRITFLFAQLNTWSSELSMRLSVYRPFDKFIAVDFLRSRKTTWGRKQQLRPEEIPSYARGGFHMLFKWWKNLGNFHFHHFVPQNGGLHGYFNFEKPHRGLILWFFVWSKMISFFFLAYTSRKRLVILSLKDHCTTKTWSD